MLAASNLGAESARAQGQLRRGALQQDNAGFLDERKNAGDGLKLHSRLTHINQLNTKSSANLTKMRTAIIMLINASVHVQPYVLISTVEIMTPAGASL